MPFTNFNKGGVYINDKIIKFLDSIPNNTEHFDIIKITNIKSHGIIKLLDIHMIVINYIKFKKLYQLNEDGDYIKNKFILDDVLKCLFEFTEDDDDNCVNFYNLLYHITSRVTMKCTTYYEIDDCDY
jgi:hypothetical protein